MMQSKYLVSVIIPAYNAASFIEECINSVINQTYKNIEIIVVNDGSIDDTETILKSYTDKRLRIINQKNKGCSAAKNKGLEFARGVFVQYLDADDILSEDKIEIQVKALKENNNCIAVCKTVVFKLNINDTNEEIDTDLISKEGS
jgi:glycosyltransferase involved in cell wall biosynthesis